MTRAPSRLAEGVAAGQLPASSIVGVPSTRAKPYKSWPATSRTTDRFIPCERAQRGASMYQRPTLTGSFF